LLPLRAIALRADAQGDKKKGDPSLSAKLGEKGFFQPISIVVEKLFYRFFAKVLRSRLF